jgi:WD40 repeat protein
MSIRVLVLAVTGLAFAVGAEGAAPPAWHADLHGDPLPPGAVARLGTVRWSGGQVRQLAFAPDSKALAVSYRSGDVSLWRVPTGKELLHISAHPGPVQALAFSSDGTALATAGVDGVRVWNTSTGRTVRHFRLLAYSFRHLAFSADGKRLAVGGTGLDSHGGGFARVWDVPSGKELHRFQHEEMLLALALSPDGERLATFWLNGERRLCRVSTGRELWAHRRSAGLCSVLAFSPDGKHLLAGTLAAMACRYDAATGKLLHAWETCEERPASRLALAASAGLVASRSQDGDVFLVSLTNGKRLRRFRAPQPGGDGELALSPDGKVLAWTGHGRRFIRLWDVATGKQLPMPAGHEAAVTLLAFHPRGHLIVTSGLDATVRLWEANTGKQRHCWTEPEAPLRCLAFSPDGKCLASGNAENTIRLWDVATAKEKRSIAPDDEPLAQVSGLAFSPAGVLLTWASVPGTIRLWDANTGKKRTQVELGPLPSPTEPLRPLATNTLMNDLISGSRCACAESATWRAFSADGKSLIGIGILRTLQLREVATGQDRGLGPPRLTPRTNREFELPQSFSAVAFAPDGHWLAVGDSVGEVRLCDLRTARWLPPLRGHRDRVRALAFSPDGRWLASASADSTVLIWRAHGLERRDGPVGASERELAGWWADLAGPDARLAYDAIWALASAKKAVPFLSKHLKPVPIVTPDRLRRLLADLDDDAFEVREKADQELADLGSVVAADLRAELQRKPPLEMFRRLERLLARLPSEELRPWRALEALENAGTAEARRLLAALSRGAPAHPLTREAKAACARLARRAVP